PICTVCLRRLRRRRHGDRRGRHRTRGRREPRRGGGPRQPRRRDRGRQGGRRHGLARRAARHDPAVPERVNDSGGGGTVELKNVHTDGAPAAIGPYSQAIVAGNLVFTAGQIPLDPKTMQMGEGDVAAQTERVLENIKAVLEAAGASLSSVVKTTVFLKDMNDFSAMNEVYARYFGDHRPARSTVEVARLPRDARVEIEAIAVVG